MSIRTLQGTLITILSFFYCHSFGQYGKGLVWDPDTYKNVPVISNEGKKNSSEGLIQRIDLSPYCPPVQHQGNNLTCTAWAVGYGAQTIEHAIQLEKAYDQTFLQEEAFSMSFIYNQIKQTDISNCGLATFIESALVLLQKTGNLKANEFDDGNCNKKPTEDQIHRAANNRISHHASLFPDSAKVEDKIGAVKSSLSSKHPVIISMDLTENFEYMNGKEFWYPDEETNPEAHAMVVVGYDDGKGEAGAFHIMNSWGTDWGKDGFFWIGYEDFGKFCLGAYQISLVPDVEIASEYQGVVRLSLPEVEDGKIKSHFLNPEFKKNTINVSNKSWKVGDTFQIHVSDVSNEQFLYAFSYDAKRETKIHWPRNKNESSLIRSGLIRITLPNGNLAFRFREVGREQVVLLFSAVPIQDIDIRLDRLRSSRYSFKRGFREAFGDILLEKNQYEFHTDQEVLSFKSRPNTVGKVIPVVYQFQIQASD